jgi:hypothetical protein
MRTDTIAAGDAFIEEALSARLALMRAEMAGESPTPLEYAPVLHPPDVQDPRERHQALSRSGAGARPGKEAAGGNAGPGEHARVNVLSR